MTTWELEWAVVRHFNMRLNLIVPNVSWGLRLGRKTMHECDLLIVSKSGYATEVELKISKADLRADTTKRHSHDHQYIKYLWFAVPHEIHEYALANIPERAGLLAAIQNPKTGRIKMKTMKKPKARNAAVQWSDTDKLALARLGCIRVFAYRNRIMEHKNAFGGT